MNARTSRVAACANILAILGLVAVSGCSGSEDGEPRRQYGHDPKVATLIEKRYAKCLDALEAGPVKYHSDGVYVALADAGELSWTVLVTDGEIVTPPTQWAAPTLKTVGC